MTHIRIRKFNTGVTYPEQNLDNDLCQAVVTRGGRTVWMRGQCPQDLDTAKNIESHDPVEQTHKVMQNIRQLVEEAGGKMEHVVKLVVSRCTESESGGRMIDAILTNTMLPDISREFLTRMMEGSAIMKVSVGVVNGEFSYQFD